MWFKPLKVKTKALSERELLQHYTDPREGVPLKNLLTEGRGFSPPAREILNIVEGLSGRGFKTKGKVESLKTCGEESHKKARVSIAGEAIALRKRWIH